MTEASFPLKFNCGLIPSEHEIFRRYFLSKVKSPKVKYLWEMILHSFEDHSGL